VTDLASRLLAAIHTHDWSWVVALAVMLIVAAVRALPSSFLTNWTKSGAGAIAFAVLASLAASLGSASVAGKSPWTLAVLMPALGIAGKAIAMWEAQKQARAAIKPGPTASVTASGTIAAKEA
jgi:hypothetical protein